MKKLIKLIIFGTIFILIGYSFVLILFPRVYIDKINFIEVVDKDDNQLYGCLNDSITSYTPLNSISEEFIQTIITVEDKRFYSHHGLDYIRIAKSMMENIKSNEITQGGSTITQQLARMTFLDNEKSYQRKFKEALLAKKIEENYSKEQILEMYINNCYFAHNLYGIDAASKYYFDKDPSLLTYGESAILVGIINAPNVYAPDISLEKAKEKQKQILYLLYENNVIDIKTYYEELSSPLNLALKKNQEKNNLLYFQDGINRQLKQLNLYNEQYLNQGLKITSSLDLDVYNKVNKIIKKHQKSVKNDEISVVVMKPYSSDILCLIGGFDYSLSPYNRALESKRQIGSTIKPFIYYLGLNKGMTPLSKFTSEETTFNIDGIGEYQPKNANGYYANRKINMVEAIGLSDNIYALKTTLLVGTSQIEKLFNQFGIEIDNINPTIGLGSISLSPLELTSLYNTLASEGYFYPPYFIKEVKLHDGTLLSRVKTKNKRVLERHSTILLSYLLQAPFDEALTSYALPSLINYQTKNTFASKTGSTHSTNWVVGYNKNFTIGVYVGNDDNLAITSKHLAKTLFKEIADSLSENYLDEFYQIDNKMTPFTLYNPLNNKKSRVYYY